MIQRIQSLYLLIAATCGVLLYFFPLASFYNDIQGNYKLFVTGVVCMDPDPRVQFSFWFALPMILLSGASLILSLAAILLFRKRPLQRRLVAINILSVVILIILIFIFYTGKIEEYTQINPSYQLGVFFPLISLVFLVLADRSIRKDEALVKSADRLR